jgi:hypothetical protein
MVRTPFSRRAAAVFASVAVVASVVVAGALAPAAATSSNSYKQTNFVSDQSGVAPVRDRHLVNAWGLAFGPSTPAWVVDAAKGVSTL